MHYVVFGRIFSLDCFVMFFFFSLTVKFVDDRVGILSFFVDDRVWILSLLMTEFGSLLINLFICFFSSSSHHLWHDRKRVIW